MKKLILLGLCVFLLVKFLESQPFSDTAYTEPGLAEVNLSQAHLNHAQAAKVEQEVRRQNEMDDGIAVNVGARTVTGQGITAAEQIGTAVTTAAGMICIGPWLVILVMYILWKLSSSKVTVH